jgi:hypothetical protein
MAFIRTTRFTADPADASEVLARRRQMLAALRSGPGGPAETRLIRVDERTWVDMWRWDSPEALQTAAEAAHHMPEATAAFALVSDLAFEQGDVADED